MLHRVSLRSVASGTVLLALLLAATGCDPLKPRHLDEKSNSNLSVAFDPQALGDRAAEMKSLKIRILKVENDTATASETEKTFTVEPQKQEYTIERVSLGLKEIQVSILDAANLALGTGSVRHLVKPGKNTTEPLVIKLLPVTRPIVSVPVELTVSRTEETTGDVKKAVLKWKAETSGQSGSIELALQDSGAAVTYAADIKSIVDEQCVGCHSGDSAAFELDLEKYPFKSGTTTDAGVILAQIMAAVDGTGPNPMPPGSPMDAPLVEKMKQWQAGGFLAAQGLTAFRGEVKEVKVADKLLCTLILFGVDSVELYRKETSGHIVVENGMMKLDIELTVEDASVSVPIIVEP